VANILDTKQVNHSAPRSRTISAGANALAHGHKAPGHLSFAQQLTQMRHASAQERVLDPNKLVSDETLIKDQIDQTIHNSNSTTKHHAEASLVADATDDEEAKLRRLEESRDHDVEYEINNMRNVEEATMDSEEISSKFNHSETVAADVGQLNHKQVTEAIREGNVAQQDSPSNDSGSRRKQLENWEDLAPKVIEDPINKAVRIDIPGINDIETLIVRMNRGAVGIQVIGSKDAMGRLVSGESELAKKLREHNIVLDSLKAFDGDAVRQASMGRKA
jgi:hypothetical protein